MFKYINRATLMKLEQHLVNDKIANHTQSRNNDAISDVFRANHYILELGEKLD